MAVTRHTRVVFENLQGGGRLVTAVQGSSARKLDNDPEQTMTNKKASINHSNNNITCWLAVDVELCCHLASVVCKSVPSGE